jgi:hypothetical protein
MAGCSMPIGCAVGRAAYLAWPPVTPPPRRSPSPLKTRASADRAAPAPSLVMSFSVVILPSGSPARPL